LEIDRFFTGEAAASLKITSRRPLTIPGRFTGGDSLRAVAGWLPGTLVSPAALGDMVSVADQFVVPAGVLIECPLGEAAATADMSLSFGRPDPAGDGVLLTSGSWRPGPAWDRLHRFVASWRDPAGSLWDEVRSLWLEFDLRKPPAIESVSFPSVFFGSSRGLRSRATILAGLDLLLDRDHTASSGAGSARGGHHANVTSGCLDALPPGADVLFVGLMAARQPEAVRLCIDAPAGQHVLRHFEQIAAAASPEPPTASMSDLLRHARHVVVQVEAGVEFSTRLGFELYMGRKRRGRADAWRPLLQRLVDEGAAREDRSAAALDWPGFAYDDHLGPRIVGRWINHIKLAYEAGALVEAKVYLQYGTAWNPQQSDTAGLVGW